MSDLKTLILNESNNGLSFFEFIIADALQSESETRFKNIKNPFYDDKNASFSIYLNNKGVWSFKDFGNPDFYGDVFNFCALYYKVDVKSDYVKLLTLMDFDLKKNSKMLPFKKSVHNQVKANIGNQITGVELSEVDFSKNSLHFWSSFGISIETLKLNNVVQITGYQQLSSGNHVEKYKYLQNQIYYAYKFHGFAKLYIPNPKKFLYVGKKARDYVFGQNFNNNIILSLARSDFTKAFEF